jgi:hypothetical protein
MWVRLEEFSGNTSPTLFTFATNRGIIYEASVQESKLIYGAGD